MGKKDKKKGKGAEKTALKTEKKIQNKLKKELAAKGEDDLEKLIAEFQEKDKQNAAGEHSCTQPSPRSAFSLCCHPDKDELLMFGGEYFNGNKTIMYNDLYSYNIKKDSWSVIQCPSKPPPRCAHQAVSLSQKGGQMWIFGGEFASPTRSNFFHYKDLWVYHIAEKIWEKIKAPGGPSSRSGHRMVASQKQLIIFGGFHESYVDYKYLNDVHLFDLDTYTWSKVDPVGKGPCPRSGCQMAALADGRLLLYGGYSREKVKKEVDKGIVHTDMYYLQIDERASNSKWKWLHVKPTGAHPSPRSGLCLASAPNNRAYLFGGVCDMENEETLTSQFYNELFLLELEKGRFLPVTLQAKDVKMAKKRRAEKSNEENEEKMVDTMESVSISSEEVEESDVKTFEDGAFTVKIGPQCSATSLPIDEDPSSDLSEQFCPHPRMNAAMVIKHGVLYLYGGLHEEGDRQLTLSDFYALDLHKLDAWRTIIPYSIDGAEWVESEESGTESCSSESEDGDGNEDDMEVS